MNLHPYAGSRDQSNLLHSGESPRHQAALRSDIDLPYRLSWDSSAAYVGRLRSQRIPGYVKLNSRLGWRATRHLETSVAVDNLLDRRHMEFYSFLDSSVAAPEVFGRSAWVGVTLRF